MGINYEVLLVIMMTTVSAAPATTTTAPATTTTASATISDAANSIAAPAADVIVTLIAAGTTFLYPC